MFCSNCGSTLEDQQKFCPNCGAKSQKEKTVSLSDLSNTKNVEIVDNTWENTAFNRDVLINYLQNIQTLEFAKQKSSEEVNEIYNKINSLGHRKNVAKNLYNLSTPIYTIVFMAIVFLVSLFVKNIAAGDGFFSFLAGLIAPVANITFIGSIIIAIIAVIVIIYEIVKDNIRYNQETTDEENRMKSELKEKKRLTSICPKVEKQLERTEKLLSDAYSINIIPSKCRNIYGAYFLYDYISTSRVSLNDALYHFDLDKISLQLDEVIEQQREIVWQLAHSNALNEQIIAQNEQLISHAIQTEKNTALAAQYAEVASINTRTTAEIQSYYWFKNGY